MRVMDESQRLIYRPPASGAPRRARRGTTGSV